MRLTYEACLAVACGFTVACCSATGPAGTVAPIVGEWVSAPLPNVMPPDTVSYFFNADGTGGTYQSQGSVSVCGADFRYSLSGDSLTLMSLVDSGPGGDSQKLTVTFANENNALTISGAGSCDAGTCMVVLSRVNTSGTNECP
jgi:hypothetical protein